MLKSVIGALALVSAGLAAVPAQAQMLCNYVNIAKAQDSINNMVDASKKDETALEITEARQSMLRGDTIGCAAHMQRLDELTHPK